VRRAILLLGAALALAGCEAYRPASLEEVERARYVSDAPPSVTLISMVNNRTGRSAHSALLINGSQQVLYDPAGTFSHPDLPRRDDIHYGMTPRFVDYYERYHARFSHHVEAHRVPISRAQADRLIANSQAEGKTLKMHCALAVADVLRPVPPFENVTRSYYPEGLRADFAAMAGVRTSYVHEVDLGKNREWERSGAAPP
jgi:hypothetical protein